LLLLSWITSLMYRMPRSLWSVEFDIYHGASVIDLSILDWHLCRMAILELLAQPHSSMPYVHMGFMTTLYTRTLFARDNGDFLPKSQHSFLNFRSVCFLFFAICSAYFLYFEKIKVGLWVQQAVCVCVWIPLLSTFECLNQSLWNVRACVHVYIYIMAPEPISTMHSKISWTLDFTNSEFMIIWKTVFFCVLWPWWSHCHGQWLQTAMCCTSTDDGRYM
jgi:hypothetical protein